MTSWTREGGDAEGESQAAAEVEATPEERRLETSPPEAAAPVVTGPRDQETVAVETVEPPLAEEHPGSEQPSEPDSTGAAGGGARSAGPIVAAAPGEAAAEADREAETRTEAAATETSKKPRQPIRALLDLLHDLLIAMIVCVLLITYVVQAFKVQGTSMSPELADGERILVNKFIYRFDEIERGDVVVFWYPDDPELSFIKRVMGLPGETIEIRAGDVYIDGELVDEPYVDITNADSRSVSPREIRPGHYFVLGDNRRGSNDSRSWGLVPQRYIYGKAFLRIWPLSDLGPVE